MTLKESWKKADIYDRGVFIFLTAGSLAIIALAVILVVLVIWKTGVGTV